MSQGYFLFCAAPFGAILTVWFAVERARRWQTFALGAVAGMLWLVLAPKGPVPVGDDLAVWTDAMWRPVWWAAAGAGVAFLLGAIYVAVVRRRFPLRAGVAALTAAVAAGGFAVAFLKTIEPIHRNVTTPAVAEPKRVLTTAELEAALWVSRNTGRDDVVATNVHCTPGSRAVPCDARAFWVAGVGGRRTVVESWGYSDATVAAHARNNVPYARQPSPYPSLQALNDRIFTHADAEALADLKQRYGVRWLVADTKDGNVSPDLADVATVRHRSGPVTVYEVP
jgi:hypothetical protein